jgi:hypothetical protein
LYQQEWGVPYAEFRGEARVALQRRLPRSGAEATLQIVDGSNARFDPKLA